MRYILNNNIKQYRKIYNVTQSELAEAVGISVNALSNIENYKHGISAYHALKIADYFNVDFHDIFQLEVIEDDGTN